MLRCRISGEEPKEPVVSKLNGNVYEKRLLEKYLKQYGQDPISSEPSSIESDYVKLELHNNGNMISPQLSNLAPSIPSLLAQFQTEWDTMALEIFELRRQLKELEANTQTKELENEACKRLIHRLKKERDEARQALINVGKPVEMEVDDSIQVISKSGNSRQSGTSQMEPKISCNNSIPSDFLEYLATTKKKLAKLRKSQSSHYEIPDLTTISDWKCTVLTSKPRSKSVYTTYSIFPKRSNETITCLNSKLITFPTQKVVKELNFESILDVVDDAAATTLGLDGKLFIVNNNNQVLFSATSENSNNFEKILDSDIQITDIMYHAELGFLILFSRHDQKINLYKLLKDNTLTQITSYQCANTEAMSSVQIHPDGALLFIGTSNGHILAFDLRRAEAGKSSAEALIDTENDAKIEKIVCSNDGLSIACLQKQKEDKTVIQIWNLKEMKFTMEYVSNVAITNISFCPDSQWLVAVSKGNLLIISCTNASKSYERQLSSKQLPVDAQFVHTNCIAVSYGPYPSELIFFGLE